MGNSITDYSRLASPKMKVKKIIIAFVLPFCLFSPIYKKFIRHL